MKAKCIRDCFDNNSATLFRTNGGPKRDGVYDIDPSALYAKHFEFEDPGAQKIRDAGAQKLKVEKPGQMKAPTKEEAEELARLKSENEALKNQKK